MAEATGTLAWVNDFASDEPTDMNSVNLRVALAAQMVTWITEKISARLKQSPELTLYDDDPDLRAIAGLQREMERMVAAKRRLQVRGR